MKIVLGHNHYQNVGGESIVVAAETNLLRARGHRILHYTKHNDRIKDMGSLSLARATVWNKTAYHELRNLLRTERPQVVHFHNTLPLISPAAYYAARAEGIPVVQTLHNYRLLCPNALFFRDGHVCEDCLSKPIPWPGVLHSCYRGSRAASGAVATMLATHRALRTWIEMVDVYIALTEFSRQKFIEGGLPAKKIVVKPNFVYPDHGPGEGYGDYILYVGRLSVNKGVTTLLAAWEQLGKQVLLKIAGDGPLEDKVAKVAQRHKGVQWLGRQSERQILALMKGARALVFPSVWYEGLPMTIVEAYSAGLPVIASNLGNMSTLIDHGRTGLHFRPGDPEDLVAQVEWALSHPSKLARMRCEARTEFEVKYTAERNYQMLMEVYEQAIQLAKKQ